MVVAERRTADCDTYEYERLKMRVAEEVSGELGTILWLPDGFSAVLARHGNIDLDDTLHRAGPRFIAIRLRALRTNKQRHDANVEARCY
jgi:hypothetical protein